MRKTFGFHWLDLLPLIGGAVLYNTGHSVAGAGFAFFVMGVIINKVAMNIAISRLGSSVTLALKDGTIAGECRSADGNQRVYIEIQGSHMVSAAEENGGGLKCTVVVWRKNNVVSQ